LQATFARYAERTAFERPLTSGVAYAVRVTHAERDQFERQQGWSIKKMYSSNKKYGPSGDAAAAEIREPAEEYAPVIFAQDAYKNVISFDMLSGDVRQDFTYSRNRISLVLVFLPCC
jgi:histidine kinase 2/3/4 (cytokinin receptor)